MENQKIESIELNSDFEESKTVTVEMQNGDILEIQLLDGLYNYSMGCLIFLNGEEVGFDNDNDYREIIESAENFFRDYEKENFDYKSTDFNCLINNCELLYKVNKNTGEVDLVAHDTSYNSNNYGTKYDVIKSFSDLDSAKEFCDKYRTRKLHDTDGLYRILNLEGA